MQAARTSLAVWKFASCDGCQLSILNLEDELLALSEAVEIAYFPEATSREIDGPYDVSLVEGSVSTPHDLERILEVRRQSAVLVTIGACATAGGIQSLRNFADAEDYKTVVYARPEFIESLAEAQPIDTVVAVDFALRGCPIDKGQLVELLSSLLVGKRPHLPTESVCTECKRRATVCLMVAGGTPCLGPVTRSGCGAICPAYRRGCYGCFGPLQPGSEVNTAHTLARSLESNGQTPARLVRLFRSFNAAAPDFSDVSRHYEHPND